MMIAGFRVLALTLCCGLYLALASQAFALPVAHARVIRDFARITFEWPDSVHFTAAAQGNSVSITFDRQANPDFGSLLKTLYPYVKHATRHPDGRTIVLTLNKPYRIRTFSSDNINGIDLLEVRPGPQNTAPRQTAKKTVKKPVKAPPPAKKTASKKPAPAEDKPTVDAELLALLSPAAGQAEPAEAPAEAQQAETPEPQGDPAATTETVSPAEEKTVPDSSEEENVMPAVPAEESAGTGTAAASPPAEEEVPVPLSYTKQDEAKTKDYVKVSLSASDDSAVLRFPFSQRMALAIFIRGNMLWVVMNKSIKLDVSDFVGDTKTVVGKPEVIPSANFTILRMPVEENIYPSATKETDSYNWAILLTASERPLKNNLQPSLRTEPPSPPHLFIPALEMADMVSVFDPLVGDEVVVTPLYRPGSGVGEARDFVEFTLLQTAQGVTVIKKADDVTVAALRDGLRVTAAEGATFTPGLPMAKIQKSQQELLDIETLFPYQRWKTQNPSDIKPELQVLFQKIIRTEDVNEANEARLAIAEIYLGQGMAAEALGLLDVIREKDPNFYRSQKLAALRGAANFLMYRYADASRDFAAGELDKHKEMDFWRKVVADLLGNPDQDYDFLALNEDYLSKYPPEMRRRLVIVAADRAIFEKEFNEAVKIIESLEEPELREPVQDYIRFLMASISAGTGQEGDALAIWDELAENYDEPFIRASAELARVMWMIEHDELTNQEAEERLERLRLAWHGDRMELQVIRLLGKIYEDKSDYVNAMRIWHGGIVSFPNSALAVEMKQKMQNAFNIMFSQGRADTLPPLDVLAMYYEYRNYAPSGGAGGEIIEKLSDRLISVDLLKQAAELLDSQMRFIAEKEQRSRLGARLAAVHLLNRRPDEALEALQDSLYGENSLLLRLVRNRLAAQAMVEQNRLASALQVLGQDTSIDAEWIRLSIYWNQRNWEKVITTVEGLFKLREDVTAPLTLDESEALLKLALAYVFENNPVQLSYLRDYFMPLMKDNPYREAFDFVTQQDIVITTTNFDEVIQHLSDTRSFIQNYRTRIKLTELAAMQEETAQQTP